METTDKTKQENKAIDRKFYEYFEKGERDKIERELWDNNYKVHFPGEAKPLSIAESKEIMKMFNTAFPDLKFTIEDQIAEGDRVVSRVTTEGTHKGEFQGVAPTGKKVRSSVIAINRIVDNKIAERWTELDNLGIMQQIGAVPELETKENRS